MAPDRPSSGSAGSFVGRAAELAAVRAAFAAGVRLVTLTGPPGAGKSRAAAELAAAEPALLRCALGEATTAADVCHALGLALRARPQPGSDTADYAAQLGCALAARGRTLVLLDDLDRAVDAAAPILVELREAAPAARFLATSRTLLRVPGEQPVELGPLAEGDAVTLIVDRAREVRPGYAPGPSERARLAEIARSLDGLPLALELAAARMAVLDPDALAARLGERLSLLVAGHRSATDRHRTLRAAIDASWEQLDAAQRDAIERLALLAGGAALDVAEAVLGPRAIDLLQSLLERSLVARDPAGRFRMVESIRLYAVEQLERSGTARTVELQVAGALLDAVRRWPFERRLRERAPLLAVAGALGGSPDRARAGAAAALLAELGDVLYETEPSPPALARVDAALANADAHGVAPATVGPLRLVRSRLLGALGDMEGAVGAAEEVLEEAGDDGALAADALCRLGGLLYLRGRTTEARRRFEAALAASGARVDPARAMLALSGLAVLDHVRGDLDAARARYEEVLQHARAAGDDNAVGRALGRLGFLALDTGDAGAAERRYDEALAIFRRTGNLHSEAHTLGYLGNVARHRGDRDLAARLYAEALEALRSIGERSWEPVVLMDEGILRVDHGELDAARVCFERSLEIGAANHRVAGLDRAYLGAIAALRGAIEEAEARFGEALGELPERDGLRETTEVLHALVDVARADRAPDEAVQLLAAARGRARDGGTAHDRMASRILRREIDRRSPPPEALVIGRGGRALRVPGGAPASLDDRPTLARLVALLARERARSPGSVVPLAAIVDELWTGERRGRAVTNRIRVAVAALRRLGLGEVLRTGGGGYYLDPAVPLVITDD